MAVDPATLPGYRPPPEYQPPRRRLSVAVLIALGGSTFFFVFFLAAHADRSLVGAYQATFYILLGLLTAERFYAGYQEDGLLGGIYRVYRPWGTYPAGDDIEHFNRYSAAALAAIAVGAVLLGLLTI